MIVAIPILILTAALATGVASSQQPTTAPPKPSSNTPDDRLATPAVPPSVTVEGCVATEEEIPGQMRKTIAERAGLDTDFVLTGAKVLKGKAPAISTVATVAAEDDVAGRAALRPMYEIRGLTNEQLRGHVGRRVRIDGSFSTVNSDPTPTAGLIELTGTTIRQVPGACAVPKA